MVRFGLVECSLLCGILKIYQESAETNLLRPGGMATRINRNQPPASWGNGYKNQQKTNLLRPGGWLQESAETNLLRPGVWLQESTETNLLRPGGMATRISRNQPPASWGDCYKN